MRSYYCFFFNDTATTEIYTLSLHDALPICFQVWQWSNAEVVSRVIILFLVYDERDEEAQFRYLYGNRLNVHRSEEHTSELQSRQYLVCRLLLEKKKTRRAGRLRSVDTRSKM